MQATGSVIYFPKQPKPARPHRKLAKSAKIIIRRLRAYRAGSPRLGLPFPIPPPPPKPKPEPPVRTRKGAL